ncbi:MAG: thiamine phosphate synthase, partial [Dehalococcoidales bacterium]|nr:thiamine phosphate synthase [Dehalococcoidales bacterium]
MMSDNTLRIIDANLNRTGEGLRLLEEISRLILNDAGLTQQFKTLRHDLLREDIAFHRQLLQARNAAEDVGAGMGVPGEDKTRSLPAVVVANAKRVQESLRTLEELTKIPGTPPELNPEKFQRARFDLYTLEQQLIAKLLRKEKFDRLHGLYVVIDIESLNGRDPVETARLVIRGGASVIQLRDKISKRKDVIATALSLKYLCANENVLFIVNDHLDVTLESDADGLHVGQEDLPVKAARKWLPADKLLGASVETIEQAIAAEADGADYLGVGAIFPTASRVKTPVVGLERLRQIKRAVSLPLVAIGGI